MTDLHVSSSSAEPLLLLSQSRKQLSIEYETFSAAAPARRAKERADEMASFMVARLLRFYYGRGGEKETKMIVHYVHQCNTDSYVWLYVKNFGFHKTSGYHKISLPGPPKMCELSLEHY